MWQLDAQCAGENPLLFEQEALKEVRDYAKDAYCARCPVAEKCLAEAFTFGLEGVWGGTDDWERGRMRAQWFRDNPQIEDQSAPDFGMLSSAVARYERRAVLVKAAYDAFMADCEAQDEFEHYEDNMACMELILGNPYSNYETLGKALGRSATWFKNRFREVVDHYGVDSE